MNTKENTIYDEMQIWNNSKQEILLPARNKENKNQENKENKGNNENISKNIKGKVYSKSIPKKKIVMINEIQLNSPIQLKVTVKKQENKEDTISKQLTNLNIKVDETKPKQRKTRTQNEYESNHILTNYGNNFFKVITKREEDEIFPDLLKRHKIKPIIRSRMVDWMYEVTDVYDCANDTYVLSVFILDKFCFKTTKVLKDDDIHLLGTTCIFLASKFEDIEPLSIWKMQNICKNEFSA